MIRVNCKRCINCNGKECRLYGDDPDKATMSCANDRFANYIQRQRKPRRERGGERHGTDRQRKR